MQLRIEHVTRYRYAPPARRVVQQFKLTPSSFAGQQVVEWEILVNGRPLSGGFHDGYGDWVNTFDADGTLEMLEIVARGTVATRDTMGALVDHREVAIAEVFLRSTPATLPDDAIRALASSIDRTLTAHARAHALSHAVADAIAYRPGTTHAHTTAVEALADGEGVCQDHAHVLIAAARLCGLPARYVSGYLHADIDGTAHEAAHAWAEINIPDYGWLGFDPSNRKCPTEHYVRVASGLDARDAAPIRGTHVGGEEEEGPDVTLTTVAGQTQQ